MRRKRRQSGGDSEKRGPSRQKLRPVKVTLYNIDIQAAQTIIVPDEQLVRSQDSRAPDYEVSMPKVSVVGKTHEALDDSIQTLSPALDSQNTISDLTQALLIL